MTHEIPDESLTGNGLQPSLAKRVKSEAPIATYDDESLNDKDLRSPIATYESVGAVPPCPPQDKDLQPPPKVRSPKRVGLTLLSLMLLAIIGFVGFRVVAIPKTDKSRDRGQQVVPVTVAKVTQKTVPVQLQAIGNVKADSTVSVTPQVGGQITGIYFKKGQDVKKGQLLFSLDDRSQNATIQQIQGTIARDTAQVQQARAVINKDLTQVRQAQANLAKDEAQAKFTTSQAGRYRDLYKQGAVSKEQAQQFSANEQSAAATLQADREAIANAQAAVEVDRAAIKNAEGVVKADQGTLENAQVQLSYTKIYSPIDGRAGDILVNQGNVVQPNNTNPLLTIYQIRNVQVSFAVPEASLPEIQKYAKDNKLMVDINFPNSNTPPIRGVLSFVNNEVNNATGTIQLLGNFDNDRGQLLPGQYVNATLTLTTQPNAIVVPSQAVQNGPKGQYVFVVNSDMTVENVPVTIGSTIDGLTVIQKGLQPNTTVAIDGQANLISGSKVQVKEPGSAGEGAQDVAPVQGSKRRGGARGEREKNTTQSPASNPQ